MVDLTLFLMTAKGEAVLESIGDGFPELSLFVVIGGDGNLDDDRSERIAEICQSRGYDHVSRSEYDNTPRSEYALAVSWRWLLAWPDEKLIVLHDSILPRYRGFSPLVNTLINGEPEVGVTAIFATEEYDKGPILAQETCPIVYPIKIAEAIEAITALYTKIVREIVELILMPEPCRLRAVPQDERAASFSIWRDEKDYFVNWSHSASAIRRMVDAVGPPYAGARTHDGKGYEIVLLNVREVDDVRCEVRHVGKVLYVEKGLPVVICGRGLLMIEEAYKLDGDTRLPYLPLASFRTRFGVA